MNDGTLLGEDYPDLFVDNQLIIEVKAAKTLAAEHVVQVLGYLRASRIEHGALIARRLLQRHRPGAR